MLYILYPVYRRAESHNIVLHHTSSWAFENPFSYYASGEGLGMGFHVSEPYGMLKGCSSICHLVFIFLPNRKVIEEFD